MRKQRSRQWRAKAASCAENERQEGKTFLQAWKQPILDAIATCMAIRNIEKKDYIHINACDKAICIDDKQI